MSFGGSAKKTSSTSSQTATQTLNPWLQSQLQGNIDSAKGLLGSYTPYSGELTAGFNPDQLGAFDQLRAVNDNRVGADGLSAASATARAIQGFTPLNAQAPTLAATSAGPATTVNPLASLGLLGSAAQGSGISRGDVRDVGLTGFSATALQPYLSPATQQLVDARMADNEHARQVQQANDAAKFGTGSWGGSRQGVADSQTNEAYQRTGDAASADARNNAWNSAVSAFFTGRGQDLQAGMANQSADLGVASKNADVSMYNAGETNQNARTGAGLLGDLGKFNADALNTRAENDASRSQAAGTTNVNNQLQATLANQRAGIDAGQLQLQGATAGATMSDQELTQAMTRAGIPLDIGNQIQKLRQSGDDAAANAAQQTLDNWLKLQDRVTSAVGQIPTFGTTQTDGKSSGTEIGVTAKFGK